MAQQQYNELIPVVDAALAAFIFHFKEYTIRQAKEYHKERGVPVRL